MSAAAATASDLATDLVQHVERLHDSLTRVHESEPPEGCARAWAPTDTEHRIHVPSPVFDAIAAVGRKGWITYHHPGTSAELIYGGDVRGFPTCRIRLYRAAGRYCAARPVA